MDVVCLLPLDFFYFKVGVNPLLRFPRCLKVSRSLQNEAEQQWQGAWGGLRWLGEAGACKAHWWSRGDCKRDVQSHPKGSVGLLAKHFISILKHTCT